LDAATTNPCSVLIQFLRLVACDICFEDCGKNIADHFRLIGVVHFGTCRNGGQWYELMVTGQNPLRKKPLSASEGILQCFYTIRCPN